MAKPIGPRRVLSRFEAKMRDGKTVYSVTRLSDNSVTEYTRKSDAIKQIKAIRREAAKDES